MIIGEKMTCLDLIVFDFDGVLVESGKDIANAVNHTLQSFKRNQIDTNTIVSYVGDGAENLLQRAFGGLSKQEMAEVLPFYKQYYLEHCADSTTLYNNVIKLLDHFKNKKLAIATNKPEQLTNSILEKFSIQHYFDIVIGPESVTKLKPNPEGILKAIEVLGTAPHRTLMVGDSDTDIMAGKAAGVHTCGLVNGIGDTDRLLASKPDFLFDDIIDILSEFR